MTLVNRLSCRNNEICVARISTPAKALVGKPQLFQASDFDSATSRAEWQDGHGRHWHLHHAFTSLHRATITSKGAVGIGVLAPENIGFDLPARIVSGDIIAPVLAVGIEPLAVIAFPFDLAPNRDQFRT
jgi:hypothetical protein